MGDSAVLTRLAFRQRRLVQNSPSHGDFREWPRGRAPFRDRAAGVPDDAAVVEPLG